MLHAKNEFRKEAVGVKIPLTSVLPPIKFAPTFCRMADSALKKPISNLLERVMGYQWVLQSGAPVTVVDKFIRHYLTK